MQDVLSMVDRAGYYRRFVSFRTLFTSNFRFLQPLPDDSVLFFRQLEDTRGGTDSARSTKTNAYRVRHGQRSIEHKRQCANVAEEWQSCCMSSHCAFCYRKPNLLQVAALSVPKLPPMPMQQKQPSIEVESVRGKLDTFPSHQLFLFSRFSSHRPAGNHHDIA